MHIGCFADIDFYIYKPLSDYLLEQKNNLSKNKNISFFDGDIKEYKNLLSAVKAVLENKDEIFIRELSVKLFNDSKKHLAGERVLWFRKKDVFGKGKSIADDKVNCVERKIIRECCPSSDVIVARCPPMLSQYAFASVQSIFSSNAL